MARLTLGDLPLRTFVIRQAGEGLHQDDVFVDGHVPDITNGVLSILRYGGEQSMWPVAVFAAGTWKKFTAAIPSEEDLKVYAAMHQQQAEDAMRQSQGPLVQVPQLAPNQGRRNH